MCDVEGSWKSAHADFSILDEDLIIIHSFFESFKACDFQEDHLDVNNNLKLVAEKLGVKNTCTRLIPFLTNFIIAGKLVELKGLASILGDFECYVGGPKYAHVLLSPLEELAGCKSSDVRMTAVRSLLAVAGIMEVSDLETYFIPMIANMAVNDQCAKKWSACHLFPAVYLRVDPKYQENLMEYYYYLSSDTLPSVRQDAAKCLSDLSEVAQLPVIITKIIPRLAQFSIDQNEHVRTLALSSAIMISKRLDAFFTEQKVIPIILNLIKDRSWGVRLTVVKNITKMLGVFGIDYSELTEIVMKMLTKLTKDQQAEVRFCTVTTVYDCAAMLYKGLSTVEADQIVVDYLIPAICSLSRDSDLKCRMEVPVVLAKFGKICPSEMVKDHLVGLTKELLQDQNIDIVFNVVKHVKDILGVKYTDAVTLPEDRLICCLKAFIINDSWEIRNAGAIHLGTLAVQMGMEFFEEYLKQAFFILLVDAKSTVQCTAMEVLKTLVNEFGMDWAQSSVVPYLINLSYTRNTHNKMAFLSFAKKFCQLCDRLTLEKLFPRVINIHSDENPNLRYAVIKILQLMMPLFTDKGDSKLIGEIKKVFKILITDKCTHVNELAVRVSDEVFDSDIPDSHYS